MENRELLKYFHVQIKQSCKSERLVVFFWYGRDQMGPGGAEIYIFKYGEPYIVEIFSCLVELKYIF